jgi:hypothetical protein
MKVSPTPLGAFESRPPRKESEGLARVGLFRGRNDERETDTEREEADTRGGSSLELCDVVETALAEALMLAARAGRWGMVEQIASELQARRYAQSHAGTQGTGQP